MPVSEIMHSIAYEKNSVGTTNKLAPSTGDNSKTASMEWHWPNDLQSRLKFPLGNYYPVNIPVYGPGTRDLCPMKNDYWFEYKLADGAIIRSKVTPPRLCWDSENRLDLHFDTIQWWIESPPSTQSVSESNPQHRMPEEIVDLTYIYQITDANDYPVSVDPIFLEAVWLGDKYNNIGPAYDISYRIRAEPSPDQMA